MRFDSGIPLCVALVAACRPSFRPEAPPPEPRPTEVAHRVASVDGLRRETVIGEWCPGALGGGAGLSVVAGAGVGWQTDTSDLVAKVAGGRPGRFLVMGHDGAVAGRFEVMGTADAGFAVDAIAGAYRGASPCSRAQGAARVEDAGCTTATRGCALAFGDAVTGGEDPVVPSRGGACAVDDILWIDGGSGAGRAYRIASFFDEGRAPAATVPVITRGDVPCAPTFARYGLVAHPGADAKTPTDARFAVPIDVLGVADLGADAKLEVVVALRYADARAIVVYELDGQGALQLRAEGQGWP